MNPAPKPLQDLEDRQQAEIEKTPAPTPEQVARVRRMIGLAPKESTSEKPRYVGFRQ